MKVLCVIDSLGSGGAQRQMVNLAIGLRQKGHFVELFTYFDDPFYRPLLDSQRINIHSFKKKSGPSFAVTRRLGEILNAGKYDAIISFLAGPNLYAVLANLFTKRKPILIVGERNTLDPDRSEIPARILSCMHVGATYVVSNSYTQAKWLSLNPLIKRKIKIIYNGYDYERFTQRRISADLNENHNLLCVGRISKQKNPLNVLKALSIHAKRNATSLRVAWAGRQENDRAGRHLRQKIEEFLDLNSVVKSNWKWLGERRDIEELFLSCDGLLHASLFEGLPNVICEAMLAGKPVIASNVCDNSLLIEDGKRGFLCNPNSPESIALAIERFESLSPKECLEIGQNAKQFAEEVLSLNRMVDSYEALLLGHATPHLDIENFTEYLRS